MKNTNIIIQAVCGIVALIGIFIMAPHFKDEQSQLSQWKADSAAVMKAAIKNGWDAPDVVFVGKTVFSDDVKLCQPEQHDTIAFNMKYDNVPDTLHSEIPQIINQDSVIKAHRRK